MRLHLISTAVALGLGLGPVVAAASDHAAITAAAPDTTRSPPDPPATGDAPEHEHRLEEVVVTASPLRHDPDGLARNKIESFLAGQLNSDKQTHTL